MALKVDDILEFIDNWRSKNGFLDDVKLKDSQIAKFVQDLQKQIEKMDFSIPKGTTVIAYSGKSNGENAWLIADKVSKVAGKDAIYISDLPAGTLIGRHRDDLKKSLTGIVGDNEDSINGIISGCDKNWNRLEGGSCGFGNNLLSLDDFVSSKLMGETVGASNNIIVFIPENIDPAKVFATTELKQIFKNDTFKYINGIPKSELEAIYRTGEKGIESVYDILKKTAKEVVGDTNGIDLQAEKLWESFSEDGILNSQSSDFSISKCYDADGNFVGVELESSKSGTLIDRPADTASSEKVVQADKKNSIGEPSDIETKKETGESGKQKDTSEAKKETGESGKQKDTAETKKETGESGKQKDKAETKKETGESGKQKDTAETKKETGESGKRNDTPESGKETGETGTKKETAGNEPDLENKKSNTDAAGTDTDTSSKKSDVTGDMDGRHTSDGSKGDIEHKSKLDMEEPDGRLTKNSKKFVDAYEEATGTKFEKIAKTVADADMINKAAEIADKLGDAMDLIEAAATIGKAGKLFSEGNEDEACKVLRDYGFSTLTSIILTEAAAAMLAALAVSNPILAMLMLGLAGYIGSEMGENISDLLDEIFGLYDDAGAYTYPVDPLIFDLDGDGIETVAVKKGVNFDFDNNGFAEKMGWVSADDGLLVRDLNNNGNIDNGNELFGNMTAIADGIYAVNGFEALAAFDLNEDGVINENDVIYSELKIWQDKNQNGVADEGELLSLQEAGIAGVGLDYDVMNETDGQGNVHTQKGYYIKADGSTGLVEDVWFDRDLSDTVAAEHLEETEEIAKLPDLQGRGNQYSLHQAMLRDKTGSLQKLVEEYVKEENPDSRKGMLTRIIYEWTGVMDYDPAGRGSNLSDARKLAALEVITGRGFNSSYGKDPVYQAGQYIEQAFGKLVDLYFAQLESQTTYADLYAKLYQEMDIDENGNVLLGTEGIMEHFKELYPIESLEGKRNVVRFVYNMKTTGALQMVNCEKFYSELSVFGNDIKHAVVYAGNDVITGTNGNDVMVGEMGNDILYGGWGDDAYIFNLGDGEDIISESGGTDKIIFGEGIREEDIRVSRDRWNLYLTNQTSGDRITVENFFNQTYYQIEKVEFADGSTWSIDDIKERATYYYGTEGDDTISAYESYYYAPSFVNDTLYGGAGNDTLYGNEGNDVLEGGTGNDTLYGGVGDDTYVFRLGDGEDVISESSGTDKLVFGEGIHGEDIRVSRDRWNLYLTNQTNGDRITVENFFNQTYYQIEKVEFADGSTWSIDDIKERATYYYGTEGDDTISAYESYYYAPSFVNDTLYGGAGNDTLYGNEGNDVLEGGTGNDTLYGGTGDDTYVFNLGDGEDVISESSGTDKLVFGEGIRGEDIRVSRDRWNLYLTNQTNGDRITVENFFNQTYYQIEKVEFADGSTWSIDDIKERATYYYGTEGDDTISAYESYYYAPSFVNDTLYGGAGNDTLYGNEGNDVLEGGTGNDTLYGGTGDDIYIFNLGDGEDVISESSGTDKLVFGEGIRGEDIRVSRDRWNLYLTNQTNGDRITVENFFNQTYYQIEKVEFADGSTWSIDDIKERATYYYGTEGDDTISAYESYYYAPSFVNDTLYGGAGNDTLYGNEGNDVLEGGTGNDTLYGGTGDDTYVFRLGDGEDVISESSGTDKLVFGEGIRGEDIRVSRDRWNLYLTNQTNGDRITVENFFNQTYYQIEKVEFADGSTWSIDDIKERATYYYGTEGDDTISAYESYYYAPSFVNDTLYGGAGNDTLYGNEGNDVLEGGTGNDTLYGGTGDDIYIFNLGDGEDVISESSGTDKLVFGEGIRGEDIRVSRDRWNLYLTNQTSGDRITVENFFNQTYYQIEKVEFADGSTWSIDDIKERATYYYGTEGDDTISAYGSYYYAPSFVNDTLYGGAGNDTLYGNEGNDVLEGGTGNDTLYGGNGNDILNGGTGNDVLYGGYGDDTYVFHPGDGRDTICEEGGNDKLIFGEGIACSDLMFARSGDDLQISLAGQEDKITISNYYHYYGNGTVESFHTSDGSTIDYTKLNLMIQAMASFEETTGMMWEDAIEQKNEQANDIVNQWWTKEVI